MGVDWYVCSLCGETFPDCGVFYTCTKGHYICDHCSCKIGEYDEDETDGEVPESACPACKLGGTEEERLSKKVAELEDANNVMSSALDHIWEAMYPGKHDWQYPGQVSAHIRAYIQEIKSSNK